MRLRIAAFAGLAASALIAATLAHAQVPAPAAPPEAPAVPQFKVEVVLFAYRDFDRGEERFDHRQARSVLAQGAVERRAAPVFDDATLESLTAPNEPAGASDPLATPAGNAPAPFRFRLLAPEELTLTRHYAALGRIDAYVPLVHGGWVQQGLPETAARPFDLALLGVRNPRGNIRLHLSRFLHLTVDLSYQDGAGPPLPTQPVFGESILTELPLAPRYSLRAERQTRSGELHYFDHPAFGLLVVVTPLPPDAVPVAPRAEPAA
jgi:hypothetical protein